MSVNVYKEFAGQNIRALLFNPFPEAQFVMNHDDHTEISHKLLRSLDERGPRYTSYPTAADFENNFAESHYLDALANSGDDSISLYVHIPFCKSLCTYCGCLMMVRKNQDEAWKYLRSLATEIQLVAKNIGKKQSVRHLHFGGGTPNFLSTDQVYWLLQEIKGSFDFTDDIEIAMEMDPRQIGENQLEQLASIGINRVSFGVQDFDPKVQEAINRIQPFELVRDVVNKARDAEIDGINFDLIYGLPHQTIESFKTTIEQTIALQPDRIALYGFAYIPELRKHQEKILPEWLPDQDLRLDLHQLALENLQTFGYRHIGMDHFARPTDPLCIAQDKGLLCRNFQGYSINKTENLIGLGLSAISETGGMFSQNTKNYRDYMTTLAQGRLPVDRGRKKTLDDLIRADVIQALMCYFEIDTTEIEQRFDIRFHRYFSEEIEKLENLQKRGLVELSESKITVTTLGRIFVRNIGMVFDCYRKNSQTSSVFSQTV